jgi:AraC-like DNA-binding protein
VPLVEAALRCGFADQSHMTRHFRKAYGLPPGRFAALAA